MNRFCLPRADKRGPLAVSGCEAAKAERVLRALFVLTEAWFVRHNATLAALEACTAVTNLFGLERHQVTAAMCSSSRAARPGALRAVNSFRAALSVEHLELWALNSESQQFILMTLPLSGWRRPGTPSLLVGSGAPGKTV